MAHTYDRRHYPNVAEWIFAAQGDVPYQNPVVGGNDLNGEVIYIGRAQHGGDTIPGKVSYH